MRRIGLISMLFWGLTHVVNAQSDTVLSKYRPFKGKRYKLSRQEKYGFYQRWILGFNYGAIWAHNEPVFHLAQSHPIQYFAEYQIQNHDKDWCKNFNHASAGFTVVLIDYRSKILGKSIAGIAFLEPRILPRLSYRIGTGFVYNTNPFTSEKNPTNVMLGSHVAMVMHAQLNWIPFYKFDFLRRKSIVGPLRLGVGLTHFSNGSFAQPNSGINNFFLSAGYWFGPHWRICKGQKMDTSQSKSVQFLISGSFSLVEKFPVGGPKYPVYQIQARSSIRMGKISRLLVGGDWMQNHAYAAEIKENPAKGSTATVVGIPIGHELLVSQNLSLVTEFGYYVYKKHDVTRNTYQRYGIRHYLRNNLFGSILLKTHRAKAECLEANVGYRF